MLYISITLFYDPYAPTIRSKRGFMLMAWDRSTVAFTKLKTAEDKAYSSLREAGVCRTVIFNLCRADRHNGGA